VARVAAFLDVDTASATEVDTPAVERQSQESPRAWERRHREGG